VDATGGGAARSGRRFGVRSLNNRLAAVGAVSSGVPGIVR
jgi:hypothetical protein